MDYSRRSVLGLIAAAGTLGVAPTTTARIPTPPAPAESSATRPRVASHRTRHGRSAVPSLAFPDQETDGGRVAIATATLDAAGFVVIATDDEIIGVSEYLAPGIYEDMQIDLDRPLFEPRSLTAAIQPAPTGNQPFDATTIQQASGQAGADGVATDTATVALARFPTAELVFKDQVTDGTIVIDCATLPEGGWIDLFVPRVDDPDGDEFQLIASVGFLEPGRYRNVKIQATFPTQPGECSVEMVALLIRDVNENREHDFEFHFPGPDSPYFPPGSERAVVTKANCSPTTC